jgi:microcystin-dependent protein
MTIATGERMYAADINNLTFFPVGTILQFSGSAYSRLTSARTEDNKVIWTLCNGTAVNGIAVPNLVNKFLRGSLASGATGDGKKTLSVSELPSHNHTMGGAGSHTHTIKEGSSSPSNNGTLTSGDDYTGIVPYYQETSTAGNHTHTINSTGNGASFDVVPAFYAVVYIMKVA